MKFFQFKTILTSAMMLVLAVALMSLYSSRQTPWVIDAKYKAMKNPVKADAASIAAGKDLYNKNCASCHGKTGLGDGVKARTLETFPGDFSKPAYQTQTDGELFGKTKVGRDEMPKYDGKIPDEDIWHMVNYSRTFKK
jgi:mono/diheme cytochrome c family protein